MEWTDPTGGKAVLVALLSPPPPALPPPYVGLCSLPRLGSAGCCPAVSALLLFAHHQKRLTQRKKKKTATPRCGCLRLSAHFSMRRVLSTIFPAHSICRFPARSPPGPIAVFPDYSTDIPTLQIRGYHSGPARGPTFDRLDQPGCPKQSAQERRAPAASAN